MHEAKVMTALGGVVLLLAGLLASGCDRDVAVEPEEGGITEPTLEQLNPNDPKPVVIFPADLRTSDEPLNRFIEEALQVCAEGDYARFRQLFAVTARPLSRDRFKKAWKAVEKIRVAGVYDDGKDPPTTYYAYALVDFRKADRQQAETKPAVVAVFKEAGQWRLTRAPRDIVERILVVATQPATAPAASAPATRPTP